MHQRHHGKKDKNINENCQVNFIHVRKMVQDEINIKGTRNAKPKAHSKQMYGSKDANEQNADNKIFEAKDF